MYCTADSFIQSTFKIILGFLAVLGMVFTLGVGAKPVKKMIHFVVVHKQDNSENMKLMSQFGERVEQRTSGEVAVQIEPGRYRLPSGKESGNGVGRAIVGVYGGQIQMSQVPIDRLLFLSTDIDVLDMPNIFTDHRHARQVLDGKVGSELQESLLKGSNNRVRGLAYTYSGGWRNIYSTKNIRFLKDLKGQKMLFRGGRMGNDIMHLLGIEPIAGFYSYEDYQEAHFDERVEAEEAEVNRIAELVDSKPKMTKAIKVVLETQHSLFLTALIVNENFFKSLSGRAQKILREEAQKLAIEERALSIAQEAANKKILESKGIKFVSLSKEDKATLAALSLKVQEKHRRNLGRFIDEIRAIKGDQNIVQSF